MGEKGMIFGAESVRAILGGTKTMTRRVVKGDIPKEAEFGYTAFTPKGHISCRGYFYCNNKKTYGEKFIRLPYQVGDIVYGKEAWTGPDADTLLYGYKADYIYKPGYVAYDYKWSSPRYMPKAAARIWLRITGVRVERLQNISEDDAKAEGITLMEAWEAGSEHFSPTYCNPDNSNPIADYIGAYQIPWNEINGKRDKGAYKWENNPFVWVYTFERIGEPRAD